MGDLLEIALDARSQTIVYGRQDQVRESARQFCSQPVFAAMARKRGNV